MATHKSTHICKPHKPTHKAKLAKECAFQPTKKNYFPTLLFLIFFCHALISTATRQDNYLLDNNSTTLTENRRAADNRYGFVTAWVANDECRCCSQSFPRAWFLCFGVSFISRVRVISSLGSWSALLTV